MHQLHLHPGRGTSLIDSIWEPVLLFFFFFLFGLQGQCASLRVTDCSQLLREWPKEVVLRDDVCSAQCGFLLRNEGPQPGLTTDLTPPPARHLRSRQLGKPPRIPSRSFPGFGGFKFPDLSVFVAK